MNMFASLVRLLDSAQGVTTHSQCMITLVGHKFITDMQIHIVLYKTMKCV